MGRKPNLAVAEGFRWLLCKKNKGINHFGYKKSICIDAEHGFVGRFVVTSANIYLSQMLQVPLDPQNQDNCVWADLAYSGQ